jgi:hypothetical protein
MLIVALCFACNRLPATGNAPPASQFRVLVDEYLDQFARLHPSIAAGNGIHSHDATLEDFSAGAIAACSAASGLGRGRRCCRKGNPNG